MDDFKVKPFKFLPKISGELLLTSLCLLCSITISNSEPSQNRQTDQSQLKTDSQISQVRAFDQVDRQLQTIRHLDDQTKEELKHAITLASEETHLSPKLIFDLIKYESSFRPGVRSEAGALGLTQVMPGTALVFCKLSPEEIFEVSSNIRCGAKYLRRLIDDFEGDLGLALAAYNTGPNYIKKLSGGRAGKSFRDIEHLIYPSTRHYVSSIQKSAFGTV